MTTPRGIRLQGPPALAVLNPADLRFRQSEFSSQPNSLPPLVCSLANLCGLFCGHLRCSALLSILHRAVATHVHLVIAVCAPAQVIDVVVRRIAIVVRNFGVPVGVWQERQRYKAVSHAPVGLAVSRLANDVRDVTERRDGSGYDYGRVANLASRFAPYTRLAPPAAQFTVACDLVLRKIWHRQPSDRGSHAR